MRVNNAAHVGLLIARFVVVAHQTANPLPYTVALPTCVPFDAVLHEGLEVNKESIFFSEMLRAEADIHRAGFEQSEEDKENKG